MKNILLIILCLFSGHVFAVGLTPITGTLNLCSSSSTALGNATGGGTWSSSDVFVAVVNATSGLVSGVSGGTAEITYTVGPDITTAVVTVNTTASAGTISAPAAICIGDLLTFTSTVPGGTWFSTNTVTATIGSTGGNVTGASTGTTIISYTADNGCGPATTTVNLAVGPVADAGSITGFSSICELATTTLTDATLGGVWSSSNTAAATVGSTGIVTAVAAGTTTISYTVTNACSTVAATKSFTVNALPAPITGTTNVCQGLTTTLNSTPGGTWSSTDITVTVNGSTGAISGAGAGTAIISYSFGTGCRRTTPFTVNATPALIGGTFVVCTGSTTTLTNSTFGGTWASSNTAVGTIDATSGVLSGLTVGTTVITYTAASCNTTGVISVGPAPDPGTISGASTLCSGNTITLTNTATGGTWSSSNTTVATIGTAGEVTGLTGGTAIITYTATAPCGSLYATHDITVNATPAALTGTTTFCEGTAETLASTPGGGTWSSSNTAVATTDVAGVVSGLAAGTSDISYTLGACSNFTTVTINPLPVAGTISGPSAVCEGSDIALTETIPGGSWSSSDISVATIGTSGIVSGVLAGTSEISYTVINGCGTVNATAAITVNTTPASITGTLSVCMAGTETLSSATSGGSWTSSNTAFATVDATSGTVAGITAGTSAITYTLGSCTTSAIMTVNALPVAGTLTGLTTVCSGSDITISATLPGGSWTSSNVTVATVGTAGIVSGVATGTTIISYTFSNSCGSVSATRTVTVTTVPPTGTISGPATACLGTNITLTNSLSGGTWSSTNLSLASISASGVLTPVAAGVVTISYTRTNSCGNAAATRDITVNVLPALITGDAVVCKTFTTTLYNADAGGTWSATGPWVAIVGSTGVATGVFAGTGVVSYTLPTGCRRTTIVTVNPVPTVITGVRHVCEGATTTLVNITGGGSWSSADPGIALIGTTGIVTGVVPGTVDISYTLPTGCYTTSVLTVNIMPTPITGIGTTCIGATTTLSSTPAGGLWTSHNSSIATVVAATGVVTGSSAATVRITYTTTGSCSQSTVITVNSTPVNIVGAHDVCEGATTTLTNPTPGGIWITSNTAVAGVVVSSGLVAGIAAGTANISYRLSTGCQKTILFTVKPLPAAITGPSAVCTGNSIALTSTPTGGTWISSHTTAAIGTPAGTVTGVTAGTSRISYRLASGCNVYTVVTINPSPSAIMGALNVCIGSTSLLSGSPVTGTWSSGNTSVITIGSTAGLASSVGIGTSTIVYTLPGTGCTSSAIMSVNPVPSEITGPDSICTGPSVLMTTTTPGGTWSSSDPVVAVAGATTGLITGATAGTTIITYKMPAGCYSTKLLKVKAIPAAVVLTGAASVCQGATTTFTASAPGGTWSVATGKISITTTGDVTGITSGFDTVKYSTNSVCGLAVASKRITIDPLPPAGTIVGNGSVCMGSTRTLLNATVGGTWESTNTAIATISATGIVTPVSAGTVVISYTTSNPCGVASVFKIVTVNPLADPGVISGPNKVCKKLTIQLENTVSTGLWSTNNAAIATVTVTGNVFGRTPGTATIRYIVSNMCNKDTAEYEVTVLSTEECAAGVETIATTTAIGIYPNPTNGAFTFETPENGALSIMTIDGRTVANYAITGKTASLSLPNDMTAGIYMVRFTGDSGSVHVLRLVYKP